MSLPFLVIVSRYISSPCRMKISFDSPKRLFDSMGWQSVPIATGLVRSGATVDSCAVDSCSGISFERPTSASLAYRAVSCYWPRDRTSDKCASGHSRARQRHRSLFSASFLAHRAIWPWVFGSRCLLTLNLNCQHLSAGPIVSQRMHADGLE